MTKDGLIRYGPFKTPSTFVTYLNNFKLPIKIVIGENQWLVSSLTAALLDPIIKIWKDSYPDELAYIEMFENGKENSKSTSED